MRAALAAALALLSMQAASGGHGNGDGDAGTVAAMAAHRRSDMYVAGDLPDGVSDASTISCNPDDLMCEYSGRCRCAEPGCHCRVKWENLPYGRLDTAAVEVAVNVSCASLRRPGAFLNSVRIGANGAGADRPIELVTYDTLVEMSRDVPQCYEAGEHPPIELQANDGKPVTVHWEWDATAAAANDSVACARRIRLVPARTVDELAGVKLTSFSIEVGPGAPHCLEREAAESHAERGAAHTLSACHRLCERTRGGGHGGDGAVRMYVDAAVRVRVWHASPSDASVTRVLIGVVFAVVWTVLMVVPLIVWMRRRRARAQRQLAADTHAAVLTAADGVAEGSRRPASRRGARGHGLRTKPRRFKALKVTDWVAERGLLRRRHGWVLADADVVREGMAIVENDPGVLGRHAPNRVVARLEKGWVQITRAAVRGLPRSVVVLDGAEEVERDEQQAHDYVLITLPQSIRYSHGISGDVRIDVLGNIVEWEGAKDSAAFRAKAETLRHELRKQTPRVGGEDAGVVGRVGEQGAGRAQDRTGVLIVVDRKDLWQSSLAAISALGAQDLARPLRIAFAGEDGSDYGGVRREWYHLITLEMVKPELHLFEACAGGLGGHSGYAYQLAAHRPASVEADGTAAVLACGVKPLEERKKQLFTAGQVLAKCIVDQQLSSVALSSTLYKRLLLRPLAVEDLEDVDRTLFNSLEWVLDCNADEEDLGMYMCIDMRSDAGTVTTVDLVEGGRDIPVTEANKKEFVEKMLHWHLIDRVAEEMDAFVAGFHAVLPVQLLSAFEPEDLELLLCGSVDVDVADWRNNTLYKAGYTAQSPVIQWFWELVGKMKNEERLTLLQFVTGTSSLPPQGFARLLGSDGERRFSILRVPDTSRLPQSHTCFNELVLPEYQTQAEFEAKLLQALTHIDDGILLR